MIQICANKIITKINNDFSNEYKEFADFPNSCIMWEQLMETVNNIQLMNLIIYCNDKFKESPVRTFLISHPSINDARTCPYSKATQALDAFWNFVFEKVLNYKSKELNEDCCIKGVTKANYFYNNEDFIEII